MKNPPTISVIVPVYNVSAYLAESLESVLGQTIGLENIEIILVDDGSTDNTADICKHYTTKFPDSIRYVAQRNKGVAAARNKGMSMALGRYINFFDADDIWQREAYTQLVKFLDEHTEIDVVAAKVKLFDGSIDEHPLSYKFNRTRVIDLDKEPDNPLMHIISCVIRRSSLEDKRFDERLKITEDAKLLSDILLEKKRYGIIASTQYNYRKRGNKSSAIDGSRTNKDYYLVTPELAYTAMADSWTTHGQIHAFMQNTLLYDISYRLEGAPYKFLTEAEEGRYVAVMSRLIKRISPSVIRGNRWYSDAQKQYLLELHAADKVDKFGFSTSSAVVVKEDGRFPLFNILFNWRFRRAGEQIRRLRRYNLTQLSPKQKLFEILKPAFIVVEAIVDIPRALIVRSGYYIQRLFKHREIWIVSDRVTAAGDNGEALFSYIKTQDVNADVYFALSKKSRDYERIRRVGPTLNHGSILYLIKFLLADKVISSHADIQTTNPFIRNVDHYGDLMDFDFVFLQHGVIVNDLSGWLNKREKNIALFVTSGRIEYDSIVNNNKYGYTEKEVKLTGLPRWDSLQNEPSNKLIIAPTYRAHLLKAGADSNGERLYDPEFKESEYAKFYNKLISDTRILAALEEHGMTGEFYVHPNFSQQARDFTTNQRISVATFPYDYRKAISEGSLLVTDYSSVVFDFSYLKKPIIYTQFDRDEFFAGHSYDKGYFFNYEEDGLGPVANTYEDAVDAIVKTINNGNNLEAQYKQRGEEFFYVFDKNNSRRVLDAIIEV